MSVILVCKKELKDSLEINNYLTKGKSYRFIKGKLPQNPKIIGYIVKDDLGLRRWINTDFKEEYFEEGE